MTREEAIELKAAVGRLMYSDNKDIRDYNSLIDFIDTALRGPTREMVERMRGEWIKKDGYTECSKCEYWYDSPENEDDGDRPSFCPSCGAPMTNEAVDMMVKRMEKMTNEH